MAAAVAEHAQATDPHDVVVAEQRLRAQARQVATGLQAEAHRSEHQGASDRHRYVDPAPDTAYGDPYVDDDTATDPRYDDPKYDGRLAADYVDPRHDDRRR